MSDVTQRLNNGQQATTDYDLSKIFLWNNRYEKDSYVQNAGYTTLTLKAGTLMGRIASTQGLAPTISGVSDGSQIPVGVLAQDITVLAGATADNVALCIAGDVNAGKVIFLGGDAWATVINGKSLRDHLVANSQILLRPVTEMTDFDN